MSRASYVAEMNLSASISWSNWWQLACWSVDDFITGPSPSPYWISANGKPTGTPNGGSFRRGPAISNQGLNRGSAKIVLAPSQTNGGSRLSGPLAGRLPTVGPYCIGPKIGRLLCSNY